MVTRLEVGRFVRHFIGAVVIFLLAKVDDDFQVRSRQWHSLLNSEGMSSAYYVLDLH